MCDENLERYLNTINQNLVEADISFRIYCHILKMRSNKRRLDIFNQAPELFTHIQNISLYDCIMKMTKIMDPMSQRQNVNIVFELLNSSLGEMANENEKKSIENLTCFLSDNLQKIRNIRNKEIAHLDEGSERHQVFENANEKRRSVRVYLNKQMELLNIYKLIWYKSKFTAYYFNTFIYKDMKNLFSPVFKKFYEETPKTDEQKQIDNGVMNEKIKCQFKIFTQNENRIINTK